jgi:hypothetical protein
MAVVSFRWPDVVRVAALRPGWQQARAALAAVVVREASAGDWPDPGWCGLAGAGTAAGLAGLACGRSARPR